MKATSTAVCTCPAFGCVVHTSSFGPVQPMPDWKPMPAPCEKCGWSHTSIHCVSAVPARLSDADVERVARRVVELLKASG